MEQEVEEGERTIDELEHAEVAPSASALRRERFSALQEKTLDKLRAKVDKAKQQKQNVENQIKEMREQYNQAHPEDGSSATGKSANNTSHGSGGGGGSTSPRFLQVSAKAVSSPSEHLTKLPKLRQARADEIKRAKSRAESRSSNNRSPGCRSDSTAGKGGGQEGAEEEVPKFVNRLHRVPTNKLPPDPALKKRVVEPISMVWANQLCNKRTTRVDEIKKEMKVEDTRRRRGKRPLDSDGLRESIHHLTRPLDRFRSKKDKKMDESLHSRSHSPNFSRSASPVGSPTTSRRRYYFFTPPPEDDTVRKSSTVPVYGSLRRDGPPKWSVNRMKYFENLYYSGMDREAETMKKAVKKHHGDQPKSCMEYMPTLAEEHLQEMFDRLQPKT